MKESTVKQLINIIEKRLPLNFISTYFEINFRATYDSESETFTLKERLAGSKEILISLSDVLDTFYIAKDLKSLEISKCSMYFENSDYLLTVVRFLLLQCNIKIEEYKRDKVFVNRKVNRYLTTKPTVVTSTYVGSRTRSRNTSRNRRFVSGSVSKKHHTYEVKNIAFDCIDDTGRRFERVASHAVTDAGNRVGFERKSTMSYNQTNAPVSSRNNLNSAYSKTVSGQGTSRSSIHRETVTTVKSKVPSLGKGTRLVQQICLDYIEVNIFYATNRTVGSSKEIYTGKRTKEKSYGVASISIPNERKRGKVQKASFLSKENKSKHFSINKGRVIANDKFYQELQNSSQEKNVFVFIHGFCTTFKEALFKAAQLKVDLYMEDTPTLLFSWPSKGKLIRGYNYDQESVEYSASFLADVLTKVGSLGFENVYIVAHSMGSLCLSKALARSSLSEQSLSRVALVAPDVEQQIFEELYLDSFRDIFKQKTIYVSSRDYALFSSNMANSGDRLGYSKKNIATYEGVETIDMTKSETGLNRWSHNYSFSSQLAVTDLHSFLINGIPAKRRPLDKIETSTGVYWMLPEF
jgi:esterase/lipase superfamily enzyme